MILGSGLWGTATDGSSGSRRARAKRWAGGRLPRLWCSRSELYSCTQASSGCLGLFDGVEDLAAQELALQGLVEALHLARGGRRARRGE